MFIPVNLGGAPEHFTSRVCFQLDLRGPNISLLAACATSLIAVHLAADALNKHECNLALAGGAQVLVPHNPGYVYVPGGPTSPTGVLRPFDSRADGTVFGSGVGVVVLKRLEDALADGNPIHSVILGSGYSNDGGNKQSFTAPGHVGQMAAISNAIQSAGISPETIGFVEAHGTGTLLGDPIEVKSTSTVFKQYTQKKQFCVLGSVKGNVGHLMNASGVMGLIKACMALENNIIPPIANYSKPNPELELENSPFFIPEKPIRWDDGKNPRRAGVSAFGFGGNNAHLILEAPPERTYQTRESQTELIILSARTPTALERQVERLANHIETHPEENLGDITHTLQEGRKAFEYRAAVAASDVNIVSEALRNCEIIHERVEKPSQVVFMLPGQGSQYPGMGRTLYETEPLYQSIVDQCADLLVENLGLDIRTLMHAENEENAEMFQQTAFTQPAIFIMEYALAKCLMASGVVPSALIGHSIGEMAAACLAGTFSMEDALSLVAIRGRLMQACQTGKMIAVFLPEAKTQKYLSDDIELSSVNAHDLTVLSGSHHAITELENVFKIEDIPYRILRTSHAFHSKFMEPAVEEFRSAVSKVKRAGPAIPFVSNTTGKLITEQQATNPEYWANHIRNPVRFSEGVDTLAELSDVIWLEVGPRQALSNLLKRQVDPMRVVAGFDEEKNDNYSVMEILANLWVRGVSLPWEKLRDEREVRKLILPIYPFEEEYYWVDPPIRKSMDVTKEPQMEVTKPPTDGPWLHTPSWRKEPLRIPELNSSEGWLVFEDPTDNGLQLGEYLRGKGIQTISVYIGDKFEELGNDCFKIRPGEKEDLTLILGQAVESGFHLKRIVHLWEMTESRKESDRLEILDESLVIGLQTLLALMHALYELGLDEGMEITVSSNGLIALDEETGPEHWEKSTLMGPCRVIPKEFPGISCQLLDVPSTARNAEWFKDALLAEAAAQKPGTLKAIREDGCYIDTMRTHTTTSSTGGIRPGGVVLITGGVGGLGLEIANRLFEMAGTKLALQTRWQPPPVDEWPKRAEQDNKIGRALKRVLELKARGADVLLVYGDAAIYDEMLGVVDEVRAHYGALHGIIHAAGIGEAKLIIQSQPADGAPVFDAKVKGALILEQILGNDPLDFFIYFSSTASVIPDAGQSRYSAANAVLDALAQRRVGSSWDKVVSISWDAWQEVGMAVDYINNKILFDKGNIIDDPLAEPVDHPLLEYCRYDPTGPVFIGRFNKHWVIDEHIVGNDPTMPGTGIVVIFLAAYRHLCGEGPVVISNITFLHLIEKLDEIIEIWVTAEEVGPQIHFEMRARVSSDIQMRLRDLKVFSSCTISPMELEAPVHIDLPVGEARVPDQLNIYQNSPHWQCLREVIETGDATVLRLSLSEDLRHETAVYELHPSLLDRAISYVHGQRLQLEGVPSTIIEMRLYGPMPAAFTAIVRDESNDTGAVNVMLLDEKMQVFANAIGYHQMRLRKENSRGKSKEHQLKIGIFGDFSSLEWTACNIKDPLEDEVQIAVHSAGVNFRDVLFALGALPGQNDNTVPMGGECSGRIAALGSGVKGFTVGDPVIATARGSLCSRLNVKANLVVDKPSNVTFEEAAGLPITFLTAKYALNNIGRIKAGERILIHSASGGVGLAAIQIAKLAGAEIFVTAGSEEKRDYLRELGVEHIMDSRNLDFAEAILDITEGEGIDLVLNSLAGEFIPAGMSILRQYGRFLEIGKRDIYENTRLEMLPFSKNISFIAIDLEPMIADSEPFFVEMFRELATAIENGQYKPAPTLAVPWEKVQEGMENIAAARHIGKVVVVINENIQRSVDKDRDDDAFMERFPLSIPLKTGLDLFQEVLLDEDLPVHVVASKRPTGSISDSGEGLSNLSQRSEKKARESSVEYRAPTNDLEKTISEIFSNVLGVDLVGIDDNFFELGGDSISSMQILSRIRRHLEVSLPHSAVMETNTVEELASIAQEYQEEGEKF